MTLYPLRQFPRVYWVSPTSVSQIYAFLRQRGELIGDADILIASTALLNGLSVVTNNLNHFRRIPELRIQNWLQS